MSRILATALAVVLVQHVLAGTNVDLGPRAAGVATGVMLACGGLGLRSRRRVPYLGDGVALALLVPLRGPLCDAARLLSPASPVAVDLALVVSLGPLAFVLGRQLGGCLHGGLPAVMLGVALGELLAMAGAAGWLPSWAAGAVVAAALAALAEVGGARHEDPTRRDETPLALLAGAAFALWVGVLARITSGYTTPSAWAGDDALVMMLLLGALVAWPASALAPATRPMARSLVSGLGALLLAAVLWMATAELALYRDQRVAVDLARALHDRVTRLGVLDDWLWWLATFAGLRAASAGLVAGALGARALGPAALGGGLALLGLAWLPRGPLPPSHDPVLVPATALLAAAGLALAAAPVALLGRRGLLLLPLAGLPFVLMPDDERPRFDGIRRQGEFAVQVLRRSELADVVLYSTPDVDSLSVEGRAAAGTTCTCERTALELTADGGLARSIEARHDASRPCYGLRIAGIPLHAGHGPTGAQGSVGRLARVFGPRGRWLVSGVGAELLAADLHDAGLLEQGAVATGIPLGDDVGFTLLDALGSRVWTAARVLDPLQAVLPADESDLDGVLVPPEHAAWRSSALHAGREHLERLARRLGPGGRCLLFLDTRALDAGALDARLAAFGAVFGERSAAFVEPRELDAPFVLALGWRDEAGRPEHGELAARVDALERSPLRTRLATPEDLSALLLRDGRAMVAGAAAGAPARRDRPSVPVRWRATGWAAVARVADPDARLDAVVRGAESRPGIDPDVLAGLAVHATYRYRLRDLNDTTYFVPDDVDWTRFDAEAAHYAAAAAHRRHDPLLQLVLAALLEPLAMSGDYGRFARVFETCSARDMQSVRLALLEAWVQSRSLEVEASHRALERARRLAAGPG